MDFWLPLPGLLGRPVSEYVSTEARDNVGCDSGDEDDDKTESEVKKWPSVWFSQESRRPGVPSSQRGGYHDGVQHCDEEDVGVEECLDSMPKCQDTIFPFCFAMEECEISFVRPWSVDLSVDGWAVSPRWQWLGRETLCISGQFTPQLSLIKLTHSS